MQGIRDDEQASHRSKRQVSVRRGRRMSESMGKSRRRGGWVLGKQALPGQWQGAKIIEAGGKGNEAGIWVLAISCAPLALAIV